MLVVIFGAGASYDSDPRLLAPASGALNHRYRPPLTKDLFHSQYENFLLQYRPAQGLIEELQAASPAIEQFLEQVRDQAKSRHTRRRQLAAIQFYLQAVMSEVGHHWNEMSAGRTGYTQLLQRIEDWREPRNEKVCLVTFNYDTLLELGCEGAGLGLRLDAVENYILNPDYFLIRPHGSVDCFYELRGVGSTTPQDPAAIMIDFAASHDVNERLVRIEWATDKPIWPYLPAISIPTQTKTDSDFVCPPQHIDVLRQALRAMTKLMVVGWRGREDHFHGIWRGVGNRWLKQLLIVEASPGAAAEVEANLQQSTSKVESHFVTSGFSGSFADAGLREMLATPAL